MKRTHEEKGKTGVKNMVLIRMLSAAGICKKEWKK